MLVRTLKKFALILLVVVVYQNWGKIEHFVNPAQTVSSQVQSQAKVTLYATEYDIEKSAEGRKAYEALGGRGIPLIDVNGTLIRGFSPEEILAALSNSST
jgi:hypothetical protein